MGDPKSRRDFLFTLAEHGAKGREIDQALVDSIKEISFDEVLLQVLPSNADLEYLGGRPLIAAMQLASASFVASIIDTGRTSRKNSVLTPGRLFTSLGSNRDARKQICFSKLVLVKQVLTKLWYKKLAAGEIPISSNCFWIRKHPAIMMVVSHWHLQFATTMAIFFSNLSAIVRTTVRSKRWFPMLRPFRRRKQDFGA